MVPLAITHFTTQLRPVSRHPVPADFFLPGFRVLAAGAGVILMMRYRAYSCIFVSVFFLWSFAPADSRAGAEARSIFTTIASSPRFRDFNASAKARFDQARAETQASLDRRVAEALTLYYDNQFQKALRAFESLPAGYRTGEFLYFYADAALKTGTYDTAVDIYRELLSVDTHLDEVRLDLAGAYYRQGKPDASRTELQRIENDAMPEYLQNRLAQLKAAVGDSPREHDVRIYLSQSVQWDSNIGASPDEDRITAPNGDLYRFSESSEKQGDWRSETLASASWDYKPHAGKGFQWETVGTVYNLEYFETDQYDSFLWKLSSGPEWTLGNTALAAPVTYGQRFYDDDRFYDFCGVNPEAAYAVNNHLIVRGGFGYFRKAYSDDEDDALNKFIRSYEIEPIFYYNPSRDYIRLSLVWQEERADSPQFSNDSLRVSLSTGRRFSEDLRGYVRYSHRFQTYEEPFPGWTSDRKDDEDSVYVSLVKDFSNGLFLDVNFYWANTDSNTEIFDYDRIICGVGIGFDF